MKVHLELLCLKFIKVIVILLGGKGTWPS